jgi:hypothetical protein
MTARPRRPGYLAALVAPPPTSALRPPQRLFGPAPLHDAPPDFPAWPGDFRSATPRPAAGITAPPAAPAAPSGRLADQPGPTPRTPAAPDAPATGAAPAPPIPTAGQSPAADVPAPPAQAAAGIPPGASPRDERAPADVSGAARNDRPAFGTWREVESASQAFPGQGLVSAPRTAPSGRQPQPSSAAATPAGQPAGVADTTRSAPTGLPGETGHRHGQDDPHPPGRPQAQGAPSVTDRDIRIGALPETRRQYEELGQGVVSGDAAAVGAVGTGSALPVGPARTAHVPDVPSGGPWIFSPSPAPSRSVGTRTPTSLTIGSIEITVLPPPSPPVAEAGRAARRAKATRQSPSRLTRGDGPAFGLGQG